MSTWQHRTTRTTAPRAAREDVANALVDTANTTIAHAPIEAHDGPQSEVEAREMACRHRRYSGYVPNNAFTRTVTEHERQLCIDARDHGASLLLDKFAEQLRHVIPHHSYTSHAQGTALFADIPREMLSPLTLDAQELYHQARQVHALHARYHGQYLRSHAAPALRTIDGLIDRFHDHLSNVAHALKPSNAANYKAETMLIDHCHELLVLMQQYRQHCAEQLPAVQPKGR